MRKLLLLINAFLLIGGIIGCSESTLKEGHPIVERKTTIQEKNTQLIELLSPLDLTSFEGIEPQEWGEHVTGVKTRIRTNEKKLALTFDACGGDYGNGYDEELVSFLKAENIPATLFVNERWIHENKELFLKLSNHSLFQIENHGTRHSPLSVNGGEAWSIPATETPAEVYEEIMQNHQTVKELTGQDMKLFRSGTAYYDEVAVQIANELGYEVVNFDILGDAGATYSSEQVKNALLGAENGSIALLHMNQPQSGTAAGVKEAVPLLKELGFEFVTLKEEILE